MSRIFFFLKSIFLTFCIAAILQIDFQDRPLEAHLMDWVTTSTVVEPIRTLAQAAADGVRRGWLKVNSLIRKKEPLANLPPAQRLSLKFERSKEFLQEQAQRAKDQAQKSLSQLEDGLANQKIPQTNPNLHQLPPNKSFQHQ